MGELVWPLNLEAVTRLRMELMGYNCKERRLNDSLGFHLNFVADLYGKPGPSLVRWVAFAAQKQRFSGPFG